MTFDELPPGISEELGKCVARDAELVTQLGWEGFVKHHRPRGDLTDLRNVDHSAKHILRQYRDRGVPVRLSTGPWTAERLEAALARGAHPSCDKALEFLCEEFIDMVNKGQFVVLPAEVAKKLPGLRVSPMGVVPQVGRRDRMVADHTYSGVNPETQPIAPIESMQFGHALERLLREILLANPAHGPVKMIKVDLSDGFYRLHLVPSDAPKLGLAFPRIPGLPDLVAVPLVLTMGWKNSPPAFSAVTETIADICNRRIKRGEEPPAHPLDDEAEGVVPEPPETGPTPRPKVPSLEVPTDRDPCLPRKGGPLGVVDVFVDDFISLAQDAGGGKKGGRRGGSNTRRVRRLLLHGIDDVFRPLDKGDSVHRREPVSLKKLRKGDCSWATVKEVLGWIINTVDMTLHLPPRRVERLGEILASLPPTQKRTSLKKWHKVLGELRSMSLAMPGARHMFSHMQQAISKRVGGRVTLTRDVHRALDDFRWLFNDITSRPTRLAEIIPLAAAAEGHHDASGEGAGGVWYPGPHLVPREGFQNKPVVWRLRWPQFIIDQLVTSENPDGTISNSDLELAGGLLHLEALAQCFDIRERTVLSKTDNLNALFWQRKGATSSDKVPPHLLRLFGIHQRYHRYVPRHDYLPGPSNPVADALSRDFFLSWNELLKSLSPVLPVKPTDCQIWTPSSRVTSSVISSLLKKRSSPESVLVEPKATTPRGTSGSSSVISWPSIPFSKSPKTKLSTYKSSPFSYEKEKLRPKEIPSGLDRLKITYGGLRRRSSDWATQTRA